MKDYRRVVVIGDSISDVKFNKRNRRKLKGAHSYPLLLKKAFPADAAFYFAGIASNRSYHVYDRFTRDCIRHNPDLVVLMIGVNDAWQEYVPRDYPPCRRPFRQHYAELLRRLNAELDCDVILATPFLIDTVAEKRPFRAFVERYAQTIAELAAPYGYRVVNMQEVFDRAALTCAPAELATDGIHPTDLGHQVIARELLRALNE